MDIPTYQGRGPSIPHGLRRLIEKVYDEDLDLTAKEVMHEVHKRLQKDKDKLGISQLRPGWPGLSAVQKVLTDYNKKKGELGPDPEDRTWSVVSYADYDIPPEALPIVLQVWAYALEQKRKPLTIRQAKWVARLSCVVKDLAGLWFAAFASAQDERIAKITDVYLTDWGSDATLYTLMTGKHVNLDTATLRSIVLREVEEWQKVKTKVLKARKKVYEEAKGGTK